MKTALTQATPDYMNAKRTIKLLISGALLRNYDRFCSQVTLVLFVYLWMEM